MTETTTDEHEFRSLELRIDQKFNQDKLYPLYMLAYLTAADEWGPDVPYHVEQQLAAWYEEHGDLDVFREAVLRELRQDELETGDDEGERYALMRAERLQDEWAEVEQVDDEDDEV